MRFSGFSLALAAGFSAFGAPAFAQETARPDPAANDLTLEDLIPADASEDPEAWAADGVEASIDQGEIAIEPARPPAAATLDALIDEPLPIFDASPEIEEVAEIDAPDLIELPELEAVQLGRSLVLAFPIDAARFPEREQFTARFRALSAIEALDSGDDTVPQLAARARSDEELLTRILRNYGYYDGEIVRQLSGGRRRELDGSEIAASSAIDSEPQVRFDVLPGAPYQFGEIDLGALNALAPTDADAFRAVFGIEPGDPLYADRIVSQEAALRLALGEGGYPFATIGTPDLLIDHAREEGDLTLPVTPGGKFSIGAIVSGDPDFLPATHLQRIARFEPGDLYRASMQSDLRRAILATGLVSSVSISPRPLTDPDGSEPGTVALDVAMERAPLRTISGAIGYGTEDGLKVEAGWEHRNLFPPEGALRLRGILGTREQVASVTFRRSNFRERDQILNIDLYASAIETEAVDARTLAVRGSLERVSNLLFQKPLSWQVGAELLYTDERNRVIGGVPRPRQTYRIVGLFSSATLDSSDDLLDPTRGFRLTGFLAPELSQSLGEETYYLRAQADASYYQSLGSTVLAGRFRAATIQGAQPFEIAPSRRLYAGGGGSVRGYGFQGIGPRNDFGEPTGGGSLVEIGLEARIQTGLLDGAVEVVPFFDAGSVALGSTPDFRFIQYGAGLGVRYKTSFGPIRVDVGAPLNPTEFDAPVVVYVSLGQAF